MEKKKSTRDQKYHINVGTKKNCSEKQTWSWLCQLKVILCVFFTLAWPRWPKNYFQSYFHNLHHISVTMVYFLCSTSIFMNSYAMWLHARFSWPGIHEHARTGTRLTPKNSQLLQSVQNILIDTIPLLDFWLESKNGHKPIY